MERARGMMGYGAPKKEQAPQPTVKVEQVKPVEKPKDWVVAQKAKMEKLWKEGEWEQAAKDIEAVLPPEVAARDIVNVGVDEVKGFERRVIGEKTLEKPKNRCDDRKINDPERGLYAVMDGVSSGHGAIASEITSRVVADRMGEKLDAVLEKASQLSEGDEDWINEAVAKAMQESVRDSNEAVEKIQKVNPEYRGACTTLSLAKLVEMPDGKMRLYYTSIGDSRVYLENEDGSLVTLTEDDNRLRAENETFRDVPLDLDVVSGLEKLKQMAAGRKGDSVSSAEIQSALSSFLADPRGLSESDVRFLTDAAKREIDADKADRLVKVLNRAIELPTKLTPEDLDALDQYTDYNALTERQKEFVGKRNVITEAIGSGTSKIEDLKFDPENPKNSDILWVDLEPGQRFVITSDGVHDNATRKQMEEVMQKSEGNPLLAESLLQELAVSIEKDEKNDRSKPDDTSAVVGAAVRKRRSRAGDSSLAASKLQEALRRDVPVGQVSVERMRASALPEELEELDEANIEALGNEVEVGEKNNAEDEADTWEQWRQHLVDSGTLDPKGRWSKPHPSLNREQMAYIVELQRQKAQESTVTDVAAAKKAAVQAFQKAS